MLTGVRFRRQLYAATSVVTRAEFKVAQPSALTYLPRKSFTGYMQGTEYIDGGITRILQFPHTSGVPASQP